MSEPTFSTRLAVLLFSDIVGSVNLKTVLGDSGAARLVTRHDTIFRETLAEFPKAVLLQDTGDGFYVRFETASDAAMFALKFQHAIVRENWGQRPLRVRVGVHLGEVTEVALEGGARKLSGLAVDLAARVTSLAEAGQILLTRSAFDSARQYVLEHPAVNGSEAPAIQWIAHGPYVMKGSDDPVDVFEVGAVGAAPLRAPPDSEKARRAVKPGDEDVLGWRPASGLEVPDRKGWFLDHKLGEGGFGEVWLGEHRKTREHRAFKFCFDADRLRSFKRELTLFRLLREVLGERDDIAKLYEVRLDKPPYYLESEFSEWGNLSEWAMRQGGIGAVPIDQRLDFVARVARAIAAAHSVGILHKDIKPSNILVHQGEGGAPRPRITDFGIGVLTDLSLLEGRNITVTGLTEGLLAENASSRTGTRMYAPPEALTGATYTMQGDIYALGVLLYQTAAGDFGKPLAQGWERDIADPILRDDIATCVAGDPARRLPSAADLADRIERLDDRREAARRAATAQRIRRGALASAAGLGILAALAGVMTLRERGLRIEADNARKAEAAQRARAEANYGEVVDLAGAMVFDIGEALKPIRGATAAYDALVRTAQDTIKRMEAQDSKDPAFLRKIADMHQRVGVLQGGLFAYVQTGDSAGAKASFARAREIREALLAGAPDDRAAMADLASSVKDTGKMLHIERKFDEAAKEFERAIELYDRAMAPPAVAGAPPPFPPSELRDIRDDWAEGKKALGDTLYQWAGAGQKGVDPQALYTRALEQYERFADHWRRRAQGAPGDVTVRRQLAVADDKRAETLLEQGTLVRKAGVALIEKNETAEGASRIEQSIDMFREAADAFGASRIAFEALVAERPEFAQYLRDAALACHFGGRAESEQAEAHESLAGLPGRESHQAIARACHERSLPLYATFQQMCQARVDEDPANIGAQRDLFTAFNKVGNALTRLDRLDEARATYAASLAFREALLLRDETAQRRRDVGVGLFKMGEIESLLAAAAPGGRSVEHLRAAETFLARSLEFFEPDTSSAKTAAKMLETCRAQLAAPQVVRQ